MANNKTFVILTASRNCARYLPDWASSIISQTYRPISVTLVDDASTDGTSKLIKSIQKSFKENNIDFEYIKSSKRIYCGSAYNLAAKKSRKKGAYFGILDSDDMLEPFACQYVADLYQKYSNVIWIYTQHNKYNRKMDRIIKKGFSGIPPKKKSLLSLGKRRGSLGFSHWRTFSNKVQHPELLFKQKLKGCVDKYMGYRLEETGIGLFTHKICYKFRTRSRGERAISFNQPLRILLEEVMKEAVYRRKYLKPKHYQIMVYKD